jgi:hypothetical protein
MGPLLILLYTADLADLAVSMGVSMQAFADDRYSAVSALQAVGNINSCIDPGGLHRSYGSVEGGSLTVVE